MKMRLLCALLAVLIAVSFAGLGESAEDGISLYYPAKDLSGLKEVRVAAEGGVSHAEKLFQKPTEVGLLPLFGEGALLSFVEDSGNVITVSVETREPISEKHLALSALALWKTLSENTSAEGVNVMVDGCAARYDGRTLNTMHTLRGGALTFEALLADAQKMRMYTVYMPDTSGNYLVPVLVPLTENVPDEEALLQYLGKTGNGDALLCAWPAGFYFAGGARLNYDFNASGRRVLTLGYSESADKAMRISAAFQQSGMQQWQFIASLVMTLTTNLGSVERVRVRLMDMMVLSFTDISGESVSFEEGEIARKSFQDRMALSILALKYDEADGKFHAERKLIASSGPDSAARILSASLEDILDEGDIKSVGISGGTAKIDLSGELYARAQSLNEKDEMLLIFALVNSAHLNLGAQSVLFTVEGRKAETFAGHIPLDGPLHPNFGLMK